MFFVGEEKKDTDTKEHPKKGEKRREENGRQWAGAQTSRKQKGRVVLKPFACWNQKGKKKKEKMSNRSSYREKERGANQGKNFTDKKH